MRVKGKASAPIVVVGDWPTREETNDGPFCGYMGDVYWDVMRTAGVPMSDVCFVNCHSKTKYPSQKLTGPILHEDAFEHLLPFLERHPRKLIFALGNNAACALGLIPKPEGINALRNTVSYSQFEYEDGERALAGVPIVTSTSPFLLLGEPEKADGTMTDFSFGARLYKGDYEPQAKVIVRDLESAEGIRLFREALEARGALVAYDHETFSLDTENPIVVATAFCAGDYAEDASGERLPVVYFWGPYDKLTPRYTEDELRACNEELKRFYGSNRISFIAHNKGFDDRVTRGQYGVKDLSSKHDTMVMSWCLSNHTYNGLKDNVSRYLGYSNYSGFVEERAKQIKARRSRLADEGSDEWEEDLKCLKFMGRSPDYSKAGKPRWPSDVDKGVGMFALVDYDTLRIYNVYDALYTYMLYERMSNLIEENGLVKSYEHRMRVLNVLMGAEDRGFLLDVKTNREMSRTAADIVSQTEQALKSHVGDEGFNPNSGAQVIKYCFGDPIKLPYIDGKDVAYHLGYTGREARRIVKETEDFMSEIYDDLDALVALGDDLDLERLESDVRAAAKKAGLPNVPISKRAIYAKGRFKPVAFTKTGLPATSSAVLQSMYEATGDEFFALLTMYKKASKLKSTFIEAIYEKKRKDDSVHPRYNAIGTNSGRISSSDFNCQNFPKAVRGQMIARPGYTFLMWDLSQAEIRAIAAMSGDEALKDALNYSDIHKFIASKMFDKPEGEVTSDERRAAKTIVFGLMYGMSLFSLRLSLGIDQEKGQEFVDMFFSIAPRMTEWLEEQGELAKKYPHEVRTPWGTRRSVRNVLSVDYQTRERAIRVAKNMPIQGAAGELTLYFVCEMVDEFRKAGLDAYFVNTVHDSACFEVADEDLDAALAIVDRVIEAGAPVPPLNEVRFKADVETGKKWDGEPNIFKAIDPRYGDSKSDVRWDLIDLESLSREEQEEMEELDEQRLAV